MIPTPFSPIIATTRCPLDSYDHVVYKVCLIGTCRAHSNKGLLKFQVSLELLQPKQQKSI